MIRLTLTYGSTTIDFQANGMAVIDGYAPEAGETPNELVTDRVDILLLGTTAAMQTLIRSINIAFEYARQHPNGSEGCWLNYAVNYTETAWRSRVKTGLVMHNPKLDARWRQGKALLALAITREPYWEGAEAIIPLTNGNGAAVTTGLPIYNCNDGSGTAPAKRQNYAEIAATDVIGDLPSPLILTVTNNYATNRLYNLWVGHNHTDPANALWNLEAEAAAGETGESDAGSSGTYQVSKTLTTDAETTLFTWALTAALLSAAKGQYVHAIPRFSYSSTLPNVRFRFKLVWNLTTLWQSDQVLPASAAAVRDLCTFRLPPWLQNITGQDALNLVMTGQRIVASSQLLRLDFLMLLPADSFRYLACVGYGIPQNSRIIDDGVSGELYGDTGAGAGRAGILSGYGDPIMVQPGKLQRLYFLMHSNIGGTAETARTITVIASYRPRRSTL